MFEFGKILGGLSDNFNICCILGLRLLYSRCWDVYGIHTVDGGLVIHRMIIGCS